MNQKLVLKGFVILLLTCVILVALVLVNTVVEGRQRYRDAAVDSIAQSYAGAQTFAGPVLVQPYTALIKTVVKLDDGKTRTDEEQQKTSEVTFPGKLTLDGKMEPSERRHGLYKAAVYVTTVHLTATIDAPDASAPASAIWGEPYLAFELSDVRGIIGMPSVRVNGVPMTMTQGGAIIGTMEQLTKVPEENADLRSYSSPPPSAALAAQPKHWQPNLRVRLPNVVRGKKSHYDVEIDMQIGGTQRLSIAPVGDLNEITIASKWPSPLFAGQFLPQSPQVGAEGFRATWSLSSLAAATQQQIANGEGDVDALNVSLLTPVDPYKLSDRATKYGILFVLLTFIGFFLFEIMKQLPIHPVQYLLVGFGLTIFFLLLISFSEHMAFGAAYVIASAASIGLLTFYLSSVLRSFVRGAAFGGMLTALYAAIYGLLISEDNALILGSLLLFVLLAAIMFVTRKVDWYKAAPIAVASPVPPGTSATPVAASIPPPAH